MNIKTWVAAGTLAVVSVASADALDELVPMPKRVTRTAKAVSPAALEKVTVRTGGVSCECGWSGDGTFAQKLEKALNTLKGLL